MIATYPSREIVELKEIDYPVVVQPFVGGIPLVWDPDTGFPEVSAEKRIPISAKTTAHIKIKFDRPIAGDLFFNSHSQYSRDYLIQCVSGKVNPIEPLTFICYEVFEPGISTSQDRIEIIDKIPRDTAGYIIRAKGPMETIAALTAKDKLRLNDLMEANLWLRGVTGLRLRDAFGRWESPEWILEKPPGWKPKRHSDQIGE